MRSHGVPHQVVRPLAANIEIVIQRRRKTKEKSTNSANKYNQLFAPENKRREIHLALRTKCFNMVKYATTNDTHFFSKNQSEAPGFFEKILCLSNHQGDETISPRFCICRLHRQPGLGIFCITTKCHHFPTWLRMYCITVHQVGPRQTSQYALRLSSHPVCLTDCQAFP
jgi:hypothetical protein